MMKPGPEPTPAACRPGAARCAYCDKRGRVWGPFYPAEERACFLCPPVREALAPAGLLGKDE